MDNLIHDREILIAAIKEILSLAESYEFSPVIRRGYVLEATRLSLRLLEIQKKIEDGTD